MISACAWVIVGRVLAPIEEISTALDSTPDLDHASPLPLPHSPMLRRLVASHNDLVARVKRHRRETLLAMVRGQELERERLSRELHDEIGQTLTYSLMAIEAASRELAEESTKVESAREAVRQALAQVRELSTDLRPGALTDLGLAAALRALATRHAEATGRTVSRDLDPVDCLDSDAEMVVYRVAQESLTNVARHSGARNVSLSLHRVGDQVRLRVVDDGVGLGSSPEGTGRRGMRERARSVGARLSVTSSPGGGTVVELDLPVTRQEDA
ncbi:MAG: sensor histidine kinase [Luteococcus japonicus]